MADLIDATSVMILAGGQATRLKDTCTNTPKPMLPVGGAPFLAYLVAYFLRCGLQPVTILAAQLGDIITQFFSQPPWGQKLVQVLIFVPQGTGGDLLKAVHLVSKPNILLLNGDTVIDFPVMQVIRQHVERHSACTVVLTRLPNVPNQGAFLVGNDGKVLSSLESDINFRQPISTETPVAWSGSSTGVVLFRKDILERIPLVGNLSLEREILPRLIQMREVTSFDNRERFFMDFGTPERLKYIQSHPEIVNSIFGNPMITF